VSETAFVIVENKLQEGAGIVSARVIAERYSVTERAVCIWANKNVIPSFRIGGKTLRFNLADVIAKLEGGAK
jgi:hypothetical protein